MNVNFLSVAEREYFEAIEYYNQEQPGLGFEFAAEVDSVIQRILEHPEAWAPISPRIRRCRVSRFPYGILYHYKEEEIVVVGVMHMRRHPNSWKDRL